MAGMINSKYNDRLDAFIDWRCDAARVGTLKDWAEANDVAYDTVRHWNTQDPSVRAIIERRLGEFNTSPERLQEIIAAMWDKAQKGDTKAAQLYLAYVERVSPSKRIEQVEGAAAEMTDEELQAALAEAMSG